MKTVQLTPRILHLAGAAVFGVLAAGHLWVIVRNAVDVPYWDEWYYFEPGALSEALNWRWVLQQHVDHRILPTHLLAWVLYRIDGLDWVTHVAVNFGIYLLLPLLYLWIARLQLQERAWVVWPFLWLLLTPHNFESHRWGFQNQWHFHQIFLALGAILLFHPRSSSLKSGLGAASLGAAIGSFAGGVLPAVWIALTNAIHRIVRAARGRSLRDGVPALAVLAFVGAAAALWAVSFEPGPKALPRVWPSEGLFWSYYLNGLGLVFGHGRRVFEAPTAIFALAVLYAFLWGFPLAWQAWREGLEADRTLRMRAVLLTGTLGGFMILTHGRAFYGVSPRYYEAVLPLLPLLALGWAGALPARKSAPVLVALWFLVAALDSPNWTDARYEAHRDAMREAEACIHDYYAGVGPGYCPTTSPRTDLAPLLERARQLEMSFARPRD